MKKANYISMRGEQRLRDELQHLWKVERPEATRRVAAAAALGDRSENAEYIYGKRRLREIDRRLTYLSKRLDELIVVKQAPEDVSRIFFGAHVSLQTDNGERSQYHLVGPDEIDPATGAISVDSPLGRSLLRKSVDDEIILQSPKGKQTFYIIEISYPGEQYVI